MLVLLLTLATATEPTVPSMEGTWRLDLKLVHDARIPVLGTSRTDSQTVQLWRVEGSPPVLTNEHCSIVAHSRIPIAKLRMPEAFATNIKPRKAPILLTKNEGAVDLAVDFGIQQVGYIDPEDGPVPTEKDDPRLFDHESDGLPAASIEVKAPLFGVVPVFVTQRSHLVLEGTLQENGTFAGQATQKALGQATVGAGNRLFATQPGLSAVPEESHFTLTRVDEETTCSD